MLGTKNSVVCCNSCTKEKLMFTKRSCLTFWKQQNFYKLKVSLAAKVRYCIYKTPRKVVFQNGSFPITTTAVCRSSDFKCKDDISHFTLGLQVSWIRSLAHNCCTSAKGPRVVQSTRGRCKPVELYTHPQHACLLWVLSKIATLCVEIRFFGYHGFNWSGITHQVGARAPCYLGQRNKWLYKKWETLCI